MLPLIFIHCCKDGEKLSENSFVWEQKTVGKFLSFQNIPSESSELVRLTVGKFCWFWNIPSSSSELVGITWSTCWKSFPSPLKVRLLHPAKLKEFSVNFFYSVYRTCCFCTLTFSVVMNFLRTTTVKLPPQQPSPAHHLTHTQREPTKGNKPDLNIMWQIR